MNFSWTASSCSRRWSLKIVNLVPRWHHMWHWHFALLITEGDTKGISEFNSSKFFISCDRGRCSDWLKTGKGLKNLRAPFSPRFSQSWTLWNGTKEFQSGNLVLLRFIWILQLFTARKLTVGKKVLSAKVCATVLLFKVRSGIRFLTCVSLLDLTNITSVEEIKRSNLVHVTSIWSRVSRPVNCTLKASYYYIDTCNRKWAVWTMKISLSVKKACCIIFAISLVPEHCLIAFFLSTVSIMSRASVMKWWNILGTPKHKLSDLLSVSIYLDRAYLDNGGIFAIRGFTLSHTITFGQGQHTEAWHHI